MQVRTTRASLPRVRQVDYLETIDTILREILYEYRINISIDEVTSGFGFFFND